MALVVGYISNIVAEAMVQPENNYVVNRKININFMQIENKSLNSEAHERPANYGDLAHYHRTQCVIVDVVSAVLMMSITARRTADDPSIQSHFLQPNQARHNNGSAPAAALAKLLSHLFTLL